MKPFQLLLVSCKMCGTDFCYIHINSIITLARLMSEIWVPDKTIWTWLLPRRPFGGDSDVQEMVCGHFQKKMMKFKE